MSKMILQMLQAVELEVAGATNSLAARRLFILSLRQEAEVLV